tara:strand:+ start:6532 stop:7254 length:723 start_codon:yes stop_codon:yes gene_type:complete
MKMRPIPSPASHEAITQLERAQRLLEKAEKLEMVEHEGKKVPAFAADGKGAKDMKEKGEGHEQKIISCLKKKGGAASLEECAKECGVSPEECKKIIKRMDNVKMSPHGDVILMDGLEKGSKKCPECGEDMNKGACMKMGCGGKMNVEKSEMGTQPGFATSFNSDPGGVMFMAESGGQTRSAYYTTNQYLYGGEDVANKGATSESITMDKLSGQLNPHDGGGVDRQVVDGILSKMRSMLES